jgi:dimethylargininase
VTTALVRPPSPSLGSGELTFLDRQPVDVEVARTQHAAYVAALRDAGLEILVAPPTPDHPDGVFVEDAVVVIDDLAILTRPGAPSRRGEGASLIPLLDAHGLEIAEMTEPGSLDGGDVLHVGDTIYVGRSTRTDATGIAQLRALAATRGRRVLGVDVPGALHLKTAVTALPDGRLVGRPSGFDASAFEGREIVCVDEPSGANVLLAGSRVIIAASAGGTAAALRQHGYDVVTVEIGELEKLEAGPTCLSVLLPSRA